MPVSTSLRRLLRIRELQEEQDESALQAALGEMSRLETALAATEHRAGSARRLVGSGVRSGSLTDRIAGLEEIRSAAGVTDVLSVRIAAAERRVAALRDSLLSSRMLRRQTKTLVEAEAARESAREVRRMQRDLDELHRRKQKRELA